MAVEPVLVAIDFTADRVSLLLAEPSGAPVRRESWPLADLADEEAWSWEVGGRVATLFAREGERRSALAIAVAAPGDVEPATGRLLHSSGQPSWHGLAVADALRRHIDAPIAVESRTVAALLGEHWQGAAAGSGDVLYVSLHGIPSAALLLSGRPARGAHWRAGALPAIPQLDPSAPPSEDDLTSVTGLLADATALLDPEVVVLDAPSQHLDRLVPLLQRIVNEIAPGPKVTAGAHGEEAALVGAVRIASTVAYEGERRE